MYSGGQIDHFGPLVEKNDNNVEFIVLDSVDGRPSHCDKQCDTAAEAGCATVTETRNTKCTGDENAGSKLMGSFLGMKQYIS